jgi:hypothetical protein
MKLILKIAAGIIVAWVLILGTGLIVGLLTAKALTETTVKPLVEQQEQLWEQTQQLTPTPIDTTVWLDLSWTECLDRDGRWAYEPGTGVVRCGVKQ